jgi:hypothetical protein
MERRGVRVLLEVKGSKQAGRDRHRIEREGPQSGPRSNPTSPTSLQRSGGALPHPLPRPGATPALAFSTGVRGIAKRRTLSIFFDMCAHARTITMIR